MAEIKNPKNQSVKNQLISITKTLLKEAENDTQKNMLLDSLAEIKKITLPGNATQSVMEQVEDFLANNYTIRFNEISLEFEIKVIENQQSKWIRLNENEIYRTIKKAHFKFSMADLIALLRSDFIPRYNPVTTYFSSLVNKWDGKTDHVGALTDFLDLGSQKERFQNMLLKWMVRAIACARGEIFNKQAIVLIGKQNNGKSTLLRWLCPEPLKDYYKEDISTDKDSKIALSKNLIINIDELSTLQKKDINSLKSIMSLEMINERIPYDRSASRMRRIASFLGSTDRYEFLSDEAGSVRWLCFLVDYIDFNYSEKINVDDLWAQAYSYYLAGRNKFNFQLTRDEIFESENFNLQFYIKGEEHEAILACFDRGCQNNHDAHITSTDAIRLFRTYTSLQTNRMSAVSVGKAFRLLGFVAQNKYNNAQRYSVKGYYVRFKDKHFFNSINI